MDYKCVFTNLCLELQQNRSWIKGLGKNPFTHSLTAVPFVRGHRSVFPRTPRNTGVYTRHPTFVTATSGVLTRLPAWLSKNRMRVYTLSDMRSKKKLRVYTASEAKGLTPTLNFKYRTSVTIDLFLKQVVCFVIAEWQLPVGYISLPSQYDTPRAESAFHRGPIWSATGLHYSAATTQDVSSPTV